MVARSNAEIDKAVETLFRLNADDEIRSIYDYRLRCQLDRDSQLAEAIEKAEAKAEAKGEAKGLEKGREEERAKAYAEKMETAKKLKDMGLSTEQIMAATGVQVN